MSKHLKWLRISAILEGTSLIMLLLIAVPAKRIFDFPELVKIIGPIHGALFLAFVVILVAYFLRKKIGWLATLIGFIASFIPFGTFVFKAKYL